MESNADLVCNGPEAEIGKSGFRSIHELEKVWQWILLDQYLLSKARYAVKSKSGMRSERKEGFFAYVIPSPAWKEVVGCMTFVYSFFFYTLINISGPNTQLVQKTSFVV